MSKIFSVFLLFSMTILPAIVAAVNLDDLEVIVSTAICPDNNCDQDCDEIFAERIGRDLPADADKCHSTEQFELLKKNLYRTHLGMIKSLPGKYDLVSLSKKIDMPIIKKQKAERKNRLPHIIDFQEVSVVSPQAITKNIRVQQRVDIKTQEKSISKIKFMHPQSEKSTQNTDHLLGCDEFSTFSHRGGSDGPENSIPAVKAGLKQHHNGVEIDIQRLSSGGWVVHHDPMIGRVSYGANGFIGSLSDKQWAQVFLLDKRGRKTTVKAPYLTELLAVFRQYAVERQVVNIEIKSFYETQYSCEELTSLYRDVRLILHPGQFIFSSTSLGTLKCLREISSSMYLGLVVEPNEKSLEKMPYGKYGTKISNYKQNTSEQLQKKIEEMYSKHRKKSRAWLQHRNFSDLKHVIGENFGLHVDYRDMEAISNTLSRAGGRWMVYSLHDDQGLLEVLSFRKSLGLDMPSGIIIDSVKESFCSSGTLQ